MIEIKNNELNEIIAGSGWFYGWLIATVIFVNGFIKGFVNPRKN